MSALEAFMSLDTLNLIALLAVVFIGLPHGAMDGALAMHFGWTSRPALVSMFLIAYVGLAGVVVLAWALAPVLTFIAFLAISVYHFGRGRLLCRCWKNHRREHGSWRAGDRWYQSTSSSRG